MDEPDYDQIRQRLEALSHADMQTVKKALSGHKFEGQIKAKSLRLEACRILANQFRWAWMHGEFGKVAKGLEKLEELEKANG